MNYYERHLGDYARDTAHLSMLEHGAYNLLLDRYYATEQGVPADQAHRLARARSKEEKAAVDAVLAEFFTLSGGLYVKNRVEEEIEKANKSIEAARLNGRKGGRPKKPDGLSERTQEKPNGFLLGSENKTQQEPSEKLTRHQTPDTKEKKAPSAPSLSVEELEAEGLDRPTAAEFLAHRQRKGAKLTALAWKGFKAEAGKAGWPLTNAVEKALARGWTSFEAAWVASDPRPNGAGKAPEKTKSLAEMGLA